MPGKHATDHQVRRYMDSRKDGYSQGAAAARAGFSERTGRRIDAAPVLPSQRDRTRRYRTRQDPFVKVWRDEVMPMLQTIPHLRATTILSELQRRHPSRYPDRLLRSLQRRVAHWRATEGPERELIFRQEHPPGRQALSDFTDGSVLEVTIAGASFPHLLYQFRLAFSGWQYVKAICGGESFTALTEGVQEALWQLGGVPREHRTDRLSAAYRNLSNQEDEAARYAEFCRHYGMEPTRNNAGISHENGAVEAAHGHLKTGLGEALELRSSRDFPDLAAYQAFLQEFIARKNAPRRAVLAVELAALLPLPRHRTTDFSTATVTVTRSATISVRGVLYTVPSRLIGCRLKVHIYDDRLVCYLGTTPVLTVRPAALQAPWPARARGRLSPPHRRLGQETAGLPAFGVPRRAFPASRLPPRLGDARRKARAAQGLPRLCRLAASRRHARLRGGARRSPRRRARRRRHARSRRGAGGSGAAGPGERAGAVGAGSRPCRL